MALGLTLKYEDSIVIGEDIEILIRKTERNNTVRLIIQAPRETKIDRIEADNQFNHHKMLLKRGRHEGN